MLLGACGAASTRCCAARKLLLLLHRVSLLPSDASGLLFASAHVSPSSNLVFRFLPLIIIFAACHASCIVTVNGAGKLHSRVRSSSLLVD